MIEFFNTVSADAWVQSIASLIGAFLAGGFALWVLYKQINYDKNSKKISALNDSLRVYGKFQLMYEKVLFQMDVILVLIKPLKFDETTKVILKEQTERMDSLIQELKNTSTGTISDYMSNVIYTANSVIESGNEIAKGFINPNLTLYQSNRLNYEKIYVQIKETLLLINEYSDVSRQQLDNLID